MLKKEKLKKDAVKDIEKALKRILPLKKLCDKNGIRLSEAASSITNFIKQNPNVTQKEFDDLCRDIDNINKNNIPTIASKIIELKIKGKV